MVKIAMPATHQGYPRMNTSGKPRTSTPSFAACLIKPIVFSTPASKSSHTGSACTAPTRTISMNSYPEKVEISNLHEKSSRVFKVEIHYGEFETEYT
jgi:hypothetical protein